MAEWIVLTAAETKEKREDERPVPDDLIHSIERYLEVYRPILAGGTAETNAFRLAINGKAMSYLSMGELIAQTTEMTIRVAVSPHLSVPQRWAMLGGPPGAGPAKPQGASWVRLWGQESRPPSDVRRIRVALAHRRSPRDRLNYQLERIPGSRSLLNPPWSY